MVELEAVELFRCLNRKELSGLRAISREKHFAAGSRIFREGEPGDGLYVIKDGAVQIAHVVGTEVRHVFSQLGPGEIFGEMAVIEDQPRSATALTVTDVGFISFRATKCGRCCNIRPALRSTRSTWSADGSANSTSFICANLSRAKASPSSVVSRKALSTI